MADTVTPRKGGPDANEIVIVLVVNTRRTSIDGGNEVSFRPLRIWQK